MTVDRHSRLRGGIYGLLVGDALGVPYEFRPPERLPPRSQLDMVPPEGFDRAHASVPAGTWSDDGAQALCLLASLTERRQLDIADLAQRLCAWFEDGYLAVGGEVFDIGIGTAAALRAIRAGAEPLSAARSDDRANGNGALMRVLPLALWHRGSDADLVRDAHLQSRITHGHRRSWACSALYCLWARRQLRGRHDAWTGAVAALRELYAEDEALTGELEFHVRPDDPAEGRGSGYVVDCLRSARMVVERADGYADAVIGAVALGHDTDTTAAVAGGMAGVRWGVEAIPERWLHALRGKDLVTPLIDALLEQAG